MPLLKRETEISPPDLFEDPASQRLWWVGHTRSRQEKALARYLRPHGVPFYLPQREKKASRAGRTLLSYLPLFPGYVFFRGSASDRQTALRSQLLVRILDVPDQATLNQELLQLHDLQTKGASLVLLHEFSSGDAVRVIRGPFQGYSGVVLRGLARPRLIVAITMLRKAVAVEFEQDALVPDQKPASSTGNPRSAVA